MIYQSLRYFKQNQSTFLSNFQCYFYWSINLNLLDLINIENKNDDDVNDMSAIQYRDFLSLSFFDF